MEENQYEYSGSQPEASPAQEPAAAGTPAQNQTSPGSQSGYQQPYGQGYQSTHQNQQPYGQGYQSAYQNQQPYGQGYQSAHQNQQPYGQGYQSAYQNQQPYGQQGYAQGYYGTPPQFAPEPAPAEPSPARINRAMLIAAIVGFVLILGFSVYCMVRDLSHGAMQSDPGGVHISIGTQKKPDVPENYKDDTGRYTVEGIAQAVRPSIVEIYTYGEVDSLVIGAFSSAIEDARTDSDWISTDPSVVDAYLADPLSGQAFSVGAYATLTDLTAEVVTKKSAAAVPKQLPLLFVAGAEDPVGSCGKDVQAAADLYRGQGVEDVRVIIYPNMRHEILNEPRRLDVYNDVEQWFTECMVMNAVIREREVEGPQKNESAESAEETQSDVSCSLAEQAKESSAASETETDGPEKDGE